MRVPGYLGRILDDGRDPVGTCFQLAPGVLATAWHVLADAGAADKGAAVWVDPLAGGARFDAVVARLDQAHDLAVLTSGTQLPASAGCLAATDLVGPGTTVTVTGHAVIENESRTARSVTATGQWTGPVTWEDATPVGRMRSEGLLRGMSGAPVIRDRDGDVVGVVSGRYNTSDDWFKGTVWVARTEDLETLLHGLVADRPRTDAPGRQPPSAPQDAELMVVSGVRSHGYRTGPASVTQPDQPKLRVRDASPRELGVHAAIQVRGSVGEIPAYVPRDIDARLQAMLNADAERGCFLLLTGSSSVGKTRTAYEAIRECLPDWWLTQPADADETRALAAQPLAQTVVWLDELQRHFEGRGITAETVRALRRTGAVVIATLWSDDYLTLTAPRRPGSPDEHRAERELLDLATVFDIDDTLSGGELRRAAALAATDGRIRAALAVTDAGPIQTLAAGPALARWWEHAPTPYAKAVITAAADARRLGLRSALTRAFLAAAAVGYLSAAQRPTAPTDWLDASLSHALTPLHGAASTLAPVPAGTDVAGPVAGYVVADYLLQHARRSRRTVCPPASCWEALLACASSRDDLRRLARAAHARLRYPYAERFYHRLADGDADAAHSLAGLLARQQRTDEAVAVLRPHAEGGVWFATAELVDLLCAQSRTDEAIAVLRLPRRDLFGIERLVELLVELGRPDDAVGVLCEHARICGVESADRLAELLVRFERTDEAIALLRRYAGDDYIMWRLACLFAHVERFDEAIEVLVAHPGAGADRGRELLVDLFAQQGRVDELRALAEAGVEGARWKLADVLCDQGLTEPLAALLDSHRDDPHFTFVVSHWLADVLAEQGRVDELRSYADAGDRSAAFELAGLLLDQGRIDEVRTRADAGDQAATWRLAQHLQRCGRLEEAIAVLRGYPDAADVASLLADLLVKQGRVDEAIEALRPAADTSEVVLTERSLLDDLLAQQSRAEELRARADSGDKYALWRLVDHLVEAEQVDDAIRLLWAHADADHPCALRLAELLAQRGRMDDLRTRAGAGDEKAARHLMELAAQRGLIEELRAHADSGQFHARVALPDALVRHGRIDELKERAGAGDENAARRLLDLLADQGDIDGLRAEVDAGVDGAAAKLTTLLTDQGGHGRHEAARIRSFGLTADGSIADPTNPEQR